MSRRSNLTVANLIPVRAVGVSYHLTLVPAQSAGGSTKPYNYLTEGELRQVLFDLGLSVNLTLEVLSGIAQDGYFWQPGRELAEAQCSKFGV